MPSGCSIIVEQQPTLSNTFDKIPVEVCMPVPLVTCKRPIDKS